MKLFLRKAGGAALHKSGLLEAKLRNSTPRYRILMYHRVIDPERLPAPLDPGMYVRPATFRMHLEELTKRYEVIPLEDIFRCVESGNDFSKPVFALTFDDGWKDNFDFAFPLLKEFKVPATVFLPTNVIGTNRHSFHEAADLPNAGRSFLSWEEVREMSAAGISFGSHTASHARLTELSSSQIEEELKLANQAFLRERVPCSSVFCYPYGAANATSEAALDKTGIYFRLAHQLQENDTTLTRVGIHDDISSTPALFALRIS